VRTDPLIAGKGRQATGVSVFIVFVTTCLFTYAIYAHYINYWAGFILVPATLLFGIPALLAFLSLAFVVPVWFLIWITLAKPNGIVCVVAVREARSAFFTPADIIKVKLTPPRAYGRAVVQQEFYSRLSTDELLAFYSNAVTRAGFTVTGIRPNKMQVNGPFHPYHTLEYRTPAGRHCEVWIFENVPYKGLEDTRLVRLEYHFNKAFGAPVVGL
jgi:hypothetical protein